MGSTRLLLWRKDISQVIRAGVHEILAHQLLQCRWIYVQHTGASLSLSLSLSLVDFPQLGYPLCNDRPRLVRVSIVADGLTGQHEHGYEQVMTRRSDPHGGKHTFRH